MPRLKYLKNTHIFCEECSVVIAITFGFAAEIAKHVGHRCRYTRVA